MSTDIRHRGRPRGARREALKGWMAAPERTSFTMGEVSKSLGWPMAAACVTMHRAVAAGDVRVLKQVRTTDAKRPVAVYACAATHDLGVSGHALVADCMQRWGR